MGVINDMTGKVIDRLTVIEQAPYDGIGHIRWKCKCACGNEIVVRGNHLRRGNTRSCGCLNKETCRETGKSQRVHGMSNTPEYRVWAGIKSRCLNEKNSAFKDYGGRGIAVCDSWVDSFEQFFNDMGARPSEDHSIDRICVDGDYAPGNCRWATVEEQQNNKRNSEKHLYVGEMLTVTQIAQRADVNYKTLSGRLRRGLSLEEALTVEKHSRRRSF